MKLSRAAASSYVSNSDLKSEARAIRKLGLNYERRLQVEPDPQNFNDTEILVVNSQFEIGPKFLEEWSRGELIVTTSSGYDHVDANACRQQGVTLARTPAARARRVSEHTLALASTLLRDLPASGQALRQGDWKRSEAAKECRQLTEEKVGIIGFGLIGKKVSETFKLLSNRPVRVNDPLKKDAVDDKPGLEYNSLKKLLRTCTLITIHADLNPASRQLMREKTLKMVPDSTLLVNTARGKTVNETDLKDALEEGEIAGAGLDVFPEEPPGPSEYFRRKNVVVTPHSAGFGGDLVEDLQAELIKTLKKFRDDEPLPHPVEPRTKKELEILRQEQTDL